MRCRLPNVVLAVVFALVSHGALAQKLVISNWDGYMPPDLLENFTRETGIETELAVHATNEEIMGKLTASGGKGFDVVFVSSPFAQALRELGLAAKLDHASITNFANLYPQAGDLGYDLRRPDDPADPPTDHPVLLRCGADRDDLVPHSVE